MNKNDRSDKNTVLQRDRETYGDPDAGIKQVLFLNHYQMTGFALYVVLLKNILKLSQEEYLIYLFK